MKKTNSAKISWAVWVFPVIALIISGYFVFQYFHQQGPRIYISFDDASGIQAEKTSVRFRGVVIGMVKDISISDKEDGIIAEVLLQKEGERFAVEGSRFTLVKPKVNFQGITGLDTLVGGTYITVLPGPEDAKKKTNYKAQAGSSLDPQDNMSPFIVEVDDAESIAIGSAVTFRGVKVGFVSKSHFSKGAQSILIQINVEDRYAYLIRENTVFWRKVGVQAKMGFLSAELKVNSLDSIVNGGLQFATPTQAGSRAKALHKFGLATAAPKDLPKWKPTLE